jgi:NAD+ synthase
MITIKTQKLIDDVAHWFADRHLNHAVVGYSGGIDSATTAALLDAAKIKTTIVQVGFKGQKFSSTTLAMEMCGGRKYMRWEYIDMPPISIFFGDAGKEAVLPIIRNAYFYGVAAELRESGERPIIVGTANFDEASFLGFWGKASDAAQDFYPISHLHKSEVYALAKELNVPQEIIKAVPSGDLQWSGELNDYKMIGATYDQIEALVKFVDTPKWKGLFEIIDFIKNTVDNPKCFVKNISKNAFKYDLPFPGFHINNRLEFFRREYYRNILVASISLEIEFDYPY